MEIDVRPCRTGEIVVMHDRTLERVTGGEDMRSIASLTLDALRAVRLAHGERVPTLEETLRLCADHGLMVNVEVKRDVPSRARATRGIAATLRRHPRSEVLVSSFDPFMLGGVAVLAPRVPVAFLLHPDHPHLEPVASLLRCVAIHPAHQLVTRSFVTRCHARGLRVHPWTVNGRGQARRLLTLGVDGIITDDPEKLRPLFA